MDSKKKTLCATEQNTERIKLLRLKFEEWQKTLTDEDVICLDEMGCKVNMTTSYAWSPKGTRVKDFVSGKATKSITTIGAMGKDGLICSAMGYGGTSSDTFYAFMKDELLPRIKK